MKAKNILFKMNLKGKGIVNFDSSDQKWMFSKSEHNNMKTRHDNTSYAKKKFYKDGDDLTYKISISSDCLRHDIFKDDVLFQSPNVINTDYLLASFIASPTSLIRGYLFANEKETLKRKGALTITDAEQTCNALSSIETFSRSGLKNKDSETTDNSYYKKEVIGDIEYETMGNIDLMQLQFVSCDQIFDRFSFNPDMFNIYKQFMKTKLPTFDSELGYYQINGSIIEIPEYGYKLSNYNVQILVRELFDRLLKLNIMRKGAYAQTSELYYKIVYDVLEDRFNNEDGWIKINSKDEISKLIFDVEDFYIEENIDSAKEKRSMIDADYEARKKDSKAKKASEDAAKKETKNKKNKKDTDTSTTEEN